MLLAPVCAWVVCAAFYSSAGPAVADQAPEAAELAWLPASTFAPPHPKRLTYWQLRARLERPTAARMEVDSAAMAALIHAEPALRYAGAQRLARAYVALKRYPEAATWWQQAAHAAPTPECARHAQAWHALSLRGSGQGPAATTAWPVSLAQTPALADWRELLTRWLDWRGVPPAAGALPAACAQQASHFALLLTALPAAGQPPFSSAAWARARARWPLAAREPEAEAWLSMVPLALAQRDVRGARALIACARRRQARWSPTQQREVLRLEAEVHMRARDYPRAIAAWRRLAATGPRAARSTAWGRLGHALVALERFDEAAAAHRQASSLAEPARERAAWLFQAAEAHFFAHDFAEALALCEHLEHIDAHGPHAASALWFAAFAAHRLYDDGTAEKLLRRLVERNDATLTPQAEYWLGRLAQGHGQPTDAHYWYRQALRRPWSVYALLARQQLGPVPLWPRALASTARDAASGSEAGGGAEGLLWASERGQRVGLWLAYDEPALAALELPLVPARKPLTTPMAWLAKAHLAAWQGDVPLAAQAATRALEGAGEQPLPPSDLPAARQLAWPLAYAADVLAASEQEQVEAAVLWALMRQESGFRPEARSSSDARGLLQLLPITAARNAAARAPTATARTQTDAAAEALAEPAANVRFGAWYLARLGESFDQQWPLAIAAYNAGPQAVARWLAAANTVDSGDLATFLELLPKGETRRYTKAVLANWALYRQRLGEPPLRLPGALHGPQRLTVSF